MKLNFSFSFLFLASALFSSSRLIAGQSNSLFQTYLETYQPKSTENHSVHLRNACREKEPTFNEMTILDVHSLMPIEAIAERVLYADADVVHLAPISSQQASGLYDMLQHTYSHFIHVPTKGRGEFVASKYPFSQVKVKQCELSNSMGNEVLEFAIYGGNVHRACLFLDGSSIQLLNADDAEETPVLLLDLLATFRVVKPQFFSFQNVHKIGFIAENTFDILPVRRGERSAERNDRSGGYCEGRVDFKSGPNGTEWSVSGRAGYEDKRGNYVEGQVSRNDKGETSGSAKTGFDTDK